MLQIAEKRNGLGWLLEPLNTLSSQLRWTLALALTAVITGVSVLLLPHMENPFLISDANQYLRLAQRKMAIVPQPFASRPLAPLLVRGLAGLLHIPLQQGFFFLGLFALIFTLLVTFGLATRTAAPRWFLFAMAATPFWPLLLHGYALPDIWYAAMLCSLLLCLAADMPLLAALMLFPLMLSRESTALTFFCLLAVGWRRLRPWGCVAAVAATAAGSVLVRHLSAGAPGNTENLPTLVYLGAKVPWNLARTLGIVPWSNVYPYLCSAPAWQHPVSLGPLHAIGVCRVSDGFPIGAVFALVTTFGLCMPLLFAVWRRRAAIAGDDLLLRFCLLYGGISFVLTPMLGTAFGRLFGYAWPLFFVALPRLFPVRSPAVGTPPPGSPEITAVVRFFVLQIAVLVTGLQPEGSSQAAVAAVLEVLGMALLFSPAGFPLRFSWIPGTPRQRGKIRVGKTPEQADFS